MRISLVLGSGGARGYAHIGAIEELLSRGHEIVAVAGSSIGALVGGAYAAGRLDDLKQTALKLTRADLWMMAQPSLNTPGLLKLDRVMKRMEQVVGDVRIEELPMPYTAVATDLLAGREIWFHSGPLLTAIRASIAIPSVFQPIMLHGRLLVDGGVVNPLPMETSLRLDADLTVAVSLFGRERGWEHGSAIEISSDESSSNPLNRLQERLADVLPTARARAVRSAPTDPFEPLPPDLDLTDMLTMSLDVMHERIQASRVAVNPPDVHVEVPARTSTLFDFDQAARIIEIGRQLAAEQFDEAGL
ncbi:patatin-like phospholipase family protein [Brooklawnia sp.]|uniref:patatin-like phospholipase family protein n=1 Tax=Brooklawnia sp. TaxID=2699740 RepID=UPI00311EE042